MKKIYGNKIKELRIAKGMSQKEFAALMGISDRAVSKWETGLSQPSANNLITAAKILDVSVEYFTSEESVDKVEEAAPQGMESITQLYKIGTQFIFITVHQCLHLNQFFFPRLTIVIQQFQRTK